MYPTYEQEQKLEQTLDGCRWVYNYFRKKNLSLEDMQLVLTELKENHPWLRNYHSKMLQMVVHQIQAARDALHALRSHGKRAGRLVYNEESNTFVYNQSGFKIERRGNTDIVWFSKVGFVEVRLHRQPRNIKQISVTKKPSGKWFANILCDEVRQWVIPTIDTSKSVGIDVGITKFCHDSDNREVENPLYFHKVIKRFRRIDKQLSRKQFGSNNYKKHGHMRARLWERIANKRHDFHHKLSTTYAKRYDLIFVEKLQVMNMVKNPHIARNILDSGWSYFKSLLQYKAKLVIEVNPAFTSVDCSRCGNSVPKTLAMRTHLCDMCGLILDRDYNAAMNILQRGRVLLFLPREPREVTLVEILALESRKQEKATAPVR